GRAHALGRGAASVAVDAVARRAVREVGLGRRARGGGRGVQRVAPAAKHRRRERARREQRRQARRDERLHPRTALKKLATKTSCEAPSAQAKYVVHRLRPRSGLMKSYAYGSARRRDWPAQPAASTPLKTMTKSTNVSAKCTRPQRSSSARPMSCGAQW